jgi:membrane protease YdiL (CAAX protease family)
VLGAWLASIVLLQLVGLLVFGAPPLARMALQSVLGLGIPIVLLRTTAVSSPVPKPAESDARGRAHGGIGWAWLASVGAGVGLALVGSSALSLFDVLIGPHWPAVRELMGHRQAFFEGVLYLDAPAMIPWVLVVMAVLPACMEEGLYRGAMRRELGTLTPRARVGAISLLFAGAHFDPFAFLPLLLAGATFGWLAERTGGIAAPVVCHLTLNAVGAVALPRWGSDSLSPGTLVGVLIAGLVVWFVSLTGMRVSTQAFRGGTSGDGAPGDRRSGERPPHPPGATHEVGDAFEIRGPDGRRPDA